jgi:phosphate transport system ATP-binding protein
MSKTYMISNDVKKFSPKMAEDRVVFKDFNLWYGGNHVLKNININVKSNIVTAFMGPSGCGKSSLLRAIDRMNDIIPVARSEGQVIIDGKNIYDEDLDVYELRKRVGMVFQKPNPFPMSIYDNVIYAPLLHGVDNEDELDTIVEHSLKGAALWEEVKDRLDDNAFSLSGGQQQRLCIARALSINPEIILMDEPCSALDPIATTKIETLMRELKENYTVILVTHNLQQAARVSEMTAFMYIGEVIEFGATRDIFGNPKEELTEKYITGRFG